MVCAVAPGKRMPAAGADLDVVVHGYPSAFDCNLDRVDPVCVERQVLPDLRYSGVWRFVGPDGIADLFTGKRY